MQQAKMDKLSTIASNSLHSGIRGIKWSQQETSPNEAEGSCYSDMGG